MAAARWTDPPFPYAHYRCPDCLRINESSSINPRVVYGIPCDDCRDARLPKVVHVIPVPAGMTPMEAWAEIDILDSLVEFDPNDPRFTDCEWAVIEADH